jgi:hypothetical protein
MEEMIVGKPQHQSLRELPGELVAELANLDPNIPDLIDLIETLPQDSQHYFYFHNLLWAYIKVLKENVVLRERQQQ